MKYNYRVRLNSIEWNLPILCRIANSQKQDCVEVTLKHYSVVWINNGRIAIRKTMMAYLNLVESIALPRRHTCKDSFSLSIPIPFYFIFFVFLGLPFVQ